MILETQEEQIRYVNNYLVSRFEILTAEHRLGDAKAIYQELVCADYVENADFCDNDCYAAATIFRAPWIFVIIEDEVQS